MSNSYSAFAVGACGSAAVVSGGYLLADIHPSITCGVVVVGVVAGEQMQKHVLTD